jgi:2-dehydro-3-deoxyphosphogluconate aldolase/(4S)-4-hydroxy-2-oxoglutarate aldolase
MARFTKLKVLTTLADQGMIPLFYNSDIELCKKVLRSVYQGGARILEFTNRGDFAHEVFGELNKYCEVELPEMILGIGSVADAATAAIYMQLGANFIVSASFREDIARTCNRRKVPYMPGCGTLTEIGNAEEMGCDIVKLFPGSVYGPGFVKAIKAPQPWTTIMPTGGVVPSEENLSAWFNAGVTCVGMGSKLIGKDVIQNGDFEGLEAKTKAALSLIEKLRK